MRSNFADDVQRCAILPKTMVTDAQLTTSGFDHARERAMVQIRSFFGYFSGSRLARVIAVIGLYALPAFLFLRRFGITDWDIWWHMATGRWILQHHAIPRTEPFTSIGVGQTWVAYSWVFDVLTEYLYRWFGFVGIVVYEALFHLVLGIALFHLVKSLLPHFWRSVAVTVLGLYVIDYLVSPRSSMLTILFGIVVLDILLSVRRTGNTRVLWLLAPIFVLWANWHIQFVYGLILVGVFAAEPLVNRIVWGKAAAVPPATSKPFWIALAGSVVATCVNPVGPYVYSIIPELMHEPKVFLIVDELRAMSFRQPQHYVVVLLALCAAVAIGWRRERKLLWPILLVFATVVALRSVKEIWFLSTIATCAIADGWVAGAWQERALFATRERLLVAVAVVAMLVAGWRRYDVSNAWLEMQVAGNFPEVASQYIEKNHLQGPLYNDFNWGGYLIWRLPGLLVSMDGRTNVYGDERVAHSMEVWGGKPVWKDDPELTGAKIILAKKNAPLTSILRLDPRYKIVFEDVQAVVFQPR